MLSCEPGIEKDGRVILPLRGKLCASVTPVELFSVHTVAFPGHAALVRHRARHRGEGIRDGDLPRTQNRRYLSPEDGRGNAILYGKVL